ncbi:MAG: futalosine hydrolase [Candidatus Eremiobacteraeota bacterium]|nr:futalosine hydrolase [Candidatus Eremiobacteraeota bacterium]
MTPRHEDSPQREDVLIVCALAAELPGFVPPPGCELLATGVGLVEASAGTAAALARKRYRAVINAGLAGAFQQRFHIGDAVLVAEERLAGLGLEDGSRIVLPGGAQLTDRAFADDDLLAQLEGARLPTAFGLTVCSVTATATTAERLVQRYGCDVESMEGFGVLRTCERARVPAVELRGVSNYVGPRAESGWDFAAGARACVSALQTVLSILAVTTPTALSQRQ